jgi:hypothetical protein
VHHLPILLQANRDRFWSILNLTNLKVIIESAIKSS